MRDIFKQNEEHPMRIECSPVKFDNDDEVDASKVNFSDPEILDQVIKDLEELEVI